MAGKRRWILVALALVVLLGAAGFVSWLYFAFPQVTADGTRIRLVPPGGRMAHSTSGPLPTELPAELVQEGVRCNAQGIQVLVEQSMFVLRERYAVRLQLVSGTEPLDTAGLGYFLFAADGRQLSEGRLTPAVIIPPHTAQMIEIVDPDLGDARRIGIRKLP